MKFCSEALLSFALLAAFSAAQSVTCDGNQRPDWNACDAIAARYNGATGYLDIDIPEGGGCAELRASPGDTSQNCQISLCDVGTTAGKAHVALAYIYTDYQFVKDQCEMENAGGRTFPPSNEGYGYLGVSNNPDFVPSKKKRAHARDMTLTKRQEQGDNGYTLYSKSTSISKPGGRFPVTGRLTSGSTFTTTESSSSSTGITGSVMVEAGFFDIFSTTVGLSVSQDYTVSSMTGITVKVDCASGQEGVIYWVPLYTYYRGYYTPSNDEVDFYVPSDSVGSRSNYEVSCLG